MIFPSAGQSVHAVQLKFPGVPQVPKLIRTDSEKKLPVTDVEQTAKGNKVKFVHKGIHLVMYEDSETSEKEIKESVLDFNKRDQPPMSGFRRHGHGHQSGVLNSPQMHIHDSNEVMPDFIGKLTVGKYSPEKIAPEMFGRGFTDSISQSHITTDASHMLQRIPSPLVAMRTISPEPDALMLDQYLNVHSFSNQKNDRDALLEQSRPNSKGAYSSPQPQRSSPFGQNQEHERKESPKSPKRFEVPLLPIGDASRINLASTYSGTDSMTSTNIFPKTLSDSTHADFSPNQKAVVPAAPHMEDFSRSKSNPSISFDDSAPPSAALGATRHEAAARGLEAIPDAQSPSAGPLNIDAIVETSTENTRSNTAEKYFQFPVHDDDGARGGENEGKAPPLSNRSFPDSPQFSLFGHKSIDAAVPPYAMRPITPDPNKSPNAISAVVVKMEGNMVPSPKSDLEDSDVFDLNFGSSARSLGQESSLSGLSDSFVKTSARSGAGTTRAMVLREQLTKANVARMESLARKSGDVTMYTSKTLAGNTGPQSTDSSEPSKKRFLQAARLVVAFKAESAPKGKNVVRKDGPAVRAAPSFAIRSQTMDISAKVAAQVAPKSVSAFQQQLEKQAQEQDDASAVSAASAASAASESKGCQLSVMTDTFDDSPCASPHLSPVPTAVAVVDAAHASLDPGPGPYVVNTGRRVSSEAVKRSARSSEEKGTSRKQSLFDFKPPDDVVVPARNKTSKFISKLKERVGKDQAQLVEQLVEEVDSTSLVSSYFDHNAAPIFVEREKVEKHVLVSKRHDKVEAREYRRKYGRNREGDEYDFESDSDESEDEDGNRYGGTRRDSAGRDRDDWQDGDGDGDGEEGEEGEGYGRDGEVRIGPDGTVIKSRSHKKKDRTEYNESGEEIKWVAGPNGEPVSVRVHSGKVKKVKPLFDLEKFVEGVTAEEKQVMEFLDQVSINKIIEAMNSLFGNTKTKGKGPSINKKNLAYFRNLIEKYKIEKIELDKLNMDLQMELIDATDTALFVTVNSIHGGNCIVILAEESADHSRRPHAIMTATAVEALPGLVAFECKTIAPDSFVDVSFANLRSETSYTAYVIADSSRAKLLPLTDEDKAPVQLLVSTLPERLEIEWTRLSTAMQVVEIKAALRTGWLKEAAAVHYPPISLPSDEDIFIEENAAETDPLLPDTTKSKAGVGDSAQAKQRKGLTSAEEEQHKNVWRTFLNWWVGQNPLAATKIRAEFLLKESLFAGQQSVVLKRYAESGLSNAAEIEALSKMCHAIDGTLVAGKMKKDGVPTPAILRKFRSWYKGGRVWRDVQEALYSNDAKSAAERTELVNAALVESLEFRNEFLQSRIDDVENCKDIVKSVIAAHAHALANGLVEEDLLFKRSVLSPEDMIAIMSTKRLLQLCIDCELTTEHKGLSDLPVEVFGNTGRCNYMFIAKADLFKHVVVRNLRPDDPPPVVMTCLPGTNRKPLKAWQLCNKNEQMLEIALACCLDVILKLALADKVVVPSPEDIAGKFGKFITRDRRVDKFVRWYAGEEETDRIPGHAPPTLQRVIFAETWESDAVKLDSFVVDILVENEYRVPDQFIGLSAAVRSMNYQSAKIMKGSGKDFFSPLVELYHETISKLSGTFVRLALMSRHLTAMLECRRISVLRWVMPPGAARTGRQFLFPRMGLLTPAFDLPPARIKPFPSRRPDAYTHQEMVNWYSSAALDEDDELMRTGEIEGVRLRSYHNWLAKERERQEEGRKQMMQEDFDCHLRREINKEVEFRLGENAKKLKIAAERSRSDEPDKDIDLKFAASLPSEYWYIFEESQEFKYGSGIHNEDEMEEYREAERQRARNAEIEAEKFENYLQEEILRRELEEQARQRREEQDRRLAEGVARRRRLREHLEDLKRQKAARIEEAERMKIEAERRHLEELAVADYHRRKEIERDQEQARILHEQQQMNVEDILVSDNRARYWEVKRMEHEDILSYRREKHDAREAILFKEKIDAMKDLYRSFEPFPDHLATDHMLSLKELLQNEPSVNQIYRDVMDTLSQSSSHRSRVDQKTESVDRKRSNRYIRIYEGVDEAHQSTESANSAATATHLSSHHSIGIDGNYIDDIETTFDEPHQEKNAFAWMRKAQNLPVRDVSHSPTKHSIRRNSAVMPNAYDMQWNLIQSNSAQCFVRTTGESFRPAADPLPTMRKLSTLGPILRPLKDTSMFEFSHLEEAADDVSPKERMPSVAKAVAHTAAVASNESDILRKFGAPPQAVDATHDFSPQPIMAVATDSFFDDSIALESNNHSAIKFDGINGTPIGNQLPFAPPPPNQTDNHPISTINEHNISYFSHTAPLHIESGIAAENSLFNASFNSSVFRSLSPSNASAGPLKTQKDGRKKLKKLLSTSADMIAKTDEKEWLQFLQTQRKATFASLATMDAKAASLKSRFDTPTDPLAPPSAGTMTQRAITPGTLSEVRRKRLHVAQLKKELQELGIVDESILDFKTRQMAKSASESVLRMQSERAMLRQYVSSGAVLRDEYYLMAVEPSERRTTSLEVSAEVKKFAEQITRQVESGGGDDGGDLNLLSIASTETLIHPNPVKQKPKSALKSARESREAPKVSLKFGIYEPPNMFMDRSEPPPSRPPDVSLDLGVKKLGRNGPVAPGLSSAVSSADIPRKASKKAATSSDQRNASLLSYPSLHTLSTISASQELAPNPFGVIRGNPVQLSAPVKDKEVNRQQQRKAHSVSSAGSLQLLTSLNESMVSGDVGKRDSTLSKSVELYINTPTPHRAPHPLSASRDLEEESVTSAMDNQWQAGKKMSELPNYLTGEGSVMSVGSTSIILD